MLELLYEMTINVAEIYSERKNVCDSAKILRKLKFPDALKSSSGLSALCCMTVFTTLLY